MQSFDYKKGTWIAGLLALLGICYAAVSFGVSEWKSLNYVNGQVPSVTVSGEGEATAVPDIATVTITIREEGATVPEAQKKAEDKVTAAMKALSVLGVEDKDRRTVSYTVNPKYENVPARGVMMYPVYNQKVVGYEAVETVEIKIRNVSQAGQVIGALGAVNITEISGPSFTVENPDKVEADAKEKAIAQARAKAAATAKALDTELGPVIQYSEDNGNNYPVVYAKSMMGTGLGAGPATDVTLPQGENVTKVRVTITYRLE